MARAGVWGGLVLIGSGAANMGMGHWTGVWLVLVGALVVALKVKL